MQRGGAETLCGSALPLVDSPLVAAAGGREVRQDAARNAAKILDAATRLVDRDGVEAVTMDAVAEAAGVGKGTVFRRYGSRAGLMGALLDHTELQFQRAMLTGPPPLGPGAPPRERLLAFGAARLELVLRHRSVLLARGDAPHGARGAYDLACTHVRHLLREAGVQGDLELLAEQLVSLVEPGWVHRQVGPAGRSRERTLAAWEDLVRRVLDAPAATSPAASGARS